MSKKLVVASELNTFKRDFEKYLIHCKETKEYASIEGFHYFVKQQQSEEAK